MTALLQLFWSFFQVGLFSFGGGYAAMPLIQAQVVDLHGWLNMTEFADIITISQMTPGPIAINSATYVGYSVGIEAGSPWFGLLGAFIATFAVCLPSLTLMLLLTRFFLKLHNNPLVEGAMKGMRPVVIGMIASAALLLIAPHSSEPGDQNFIDAWSWVLFGGVFIGSLRKVNPILLIILSAVAGILIYYVF